jgi:hypothetical protein
MVPASTMIPHRNTRSQHETEFSSGTRTYVARRTAEGLSKKEIIRCLKRYIARELYKILTRPKTATLPGKDLPAAA